MSNKTVTKAKRRIVVKHNPIAQAVTRIVNPLESAARLDETAKRQAALSVKPTALPASAKVIAKDSAKVKVAPTASTTAHQRTLYAFISTPSSIKALRPYFLAMFQVQSPRNALTVGAPCFQPYKALPQHTPEKMTHVGASRYALTAFGLQYFSSDIERAKFGETKKECNGKLADMRSAISTGKAPAWYRLPMHKVFV